MSSCPVPISVVVVPLVGGHALERLLERLSGPDVLPAGAEVLVVAAAPPPHRGAGAWIRSAPDTPVPSRRALGARAATGDVVALLEDTVLPEPGWGAAAVDLHREWSETSAIGGTLRLDPALPPRAAALALLEYGRFVRRGRVAEPAPALPGNDMTFKRRALVCAGVTQGRPLREAELVPELARERDRVRLDSRLAVTCVAVDPKGAASRSRFLHGRLYAGHRLPTSALRARIARAVATPLLPAVMLGRCIGALRRARVRHPFRVLAHALWMGIAWSAGEGVGYLCGAGRSEEAWT